VLGYKWFRIVFPPVAFRPDSGLCPPLLGLSGHTHWTHHSR